MWAIGFLFVLTVYGAVAWSLAYVVRRYTKSNVAAVLVLVIFVLIPTWDIVPGRLYFKHLCDTEAGVKVFKTVEVAPANFRPNGLPDERKLQDRYEGASEIDKQFSEFFHIWKVETTLTDKKTGEQLGASSSFVHFGGWVMTTIKYGVSGTWCPRDAHGLLLRQAIKPKNAS